MWWEALPSLGIMGFGLALPEIFNYATNLFFRDVPYVRRIATTSDSVHYMRDRRLTGLSHPYKQIGLDNLEDYCSPPPPPPEEECTCPPKEGSSK